MKKCIQCKEDKPLSEFYKNKSTYDGAQKRCKSCDVLRNKQKYQKDPLEAARKRKSLRLKRDFNLTWEQYQELKNKQDNKCDICKVELFEAKNTCVDHNHITGKVRGILCQKCNKALGLFQDSIEKLNAAVKYLSHHEKQNG
jgi:hypothetical protein